MRNSVLKELTAMDTFMFNCFFLWAYTALTPIFRSPKLYHNPCLSFIATFNVESVTFSLTSYFNAQTLMIILKVLTSRIKFPVACAQNVVQY